MLFQIPYGGGTLREVFYYLEYWGISDVILPFILIFTVVYAVLMKIGLFKEGKGTDASPSSRFNGVIALAISLMAVIPHVLGKYPPGQDIIVIINTALPEVVLLIIAVVMLLIMTGIAWGKAPEESAWAGFVAIGAGLILIGIFASNIWPIPWISNIDPALLSLLIAILVFGLVFWFVTKKESGKGETMQGIKDFFKKVSE